MKTASRRARTLVAATLIAAAATGCIEFEQQTLTYRYDTGRDTLLIHQTYRGIHGTDAPGMLSSREEEQLLSVWNGERTFFFGNWISELDLTSWRRNLNVPLADDLTDTARAYETAMRKVIVLMIANTHISNGPFHRNAAGELCGVQRVEITHFARILPAANDAMRAAFADEATNENNDDAERARFARAAVDPAPFLALAGNRISVRFPASQADYDKETNAPDGDALAWLRAGATMTFVDDMITVTIGREDSDRESLTLPEQPVAVEPNAVAFVRDHFGIAEKFDPAADAEQFLSSQ